ncbi:MAG: hypothetical protein ACYCW6_26735 [Candidatus Xenobia bacterium]
MSWSRGFTAAFALAVTAAGMVLLRAPIVTKPLQPVMVLVGVVVLTLQALAVNRLAGIDFPVWAPRGEPLPHPERNLTCPVE